MHEETMMYEGPGLILLVEMRDAYQRRMRTLLGGEGYLVDRVRTGDEMLTYFESSIATAWELASAELNATRPRLPDLVVLGHSSGLSGEELGFVLSLDWALPVLAITGSSADPMRGALRWGIDQAVHAPIDPEDLAELVVDLVPAEANLSALPARDWHV